ncbi:hypothetical protein [Micromonospora psammae]|uniref:hypothetical protein n=1 Tax=Micromonospora sp. CPCC 205556 TaxID=3122398 RepID=UPI002FF3C139
MPRSLPVDVGPTHPLSVRRPVTADSLDRERIGRKVGAVADDRAGVRRRRLLWAGILALVGLVLLALGLTVADGVIAGIEVVLAIALLVASYAVQHLARRESLYRHDDRR